jgi:type IV secretory pathway VirB4 component
MPTLILLFFDVHDLQNAEDQVKRAQYFNVLSFVWNILERDRRERTVLVVDEAWMLVDPQTPRAIAFLRDTSKRIRKYNGSLIVISQNVIDFLAPEVQRYGQALLDNPRYKLLLAQGEKDLEAITALMNLSGAEHDLLANAKR